MNDSVLPVGKLPPALLAQLLSQAPTDDPRIVLGPGPGIDCAVIDLGTTYLVLKSDPITFASDEIGWYLVQVNANDIATTGAKPRWLLITALLPEGRTTYRKVESMAEEIFNACQAIGVSVIGGHTEITAGLNRPLIVGTMIGEVEPDRLVSPTAARPGDKILLTKGVPIEATAILAREFPEKLRAFLSDEELQAAGNFLHHPGISVLEDARVAIGAGKVTAMHDPTEGGLAAALWELAEACGRTLVIDRSLIPVPPVSLKICQALKLDPFAAISSGALLLTVAPSDAHSIALALQAEGIDCTNIGQVQEGPAVVQTATPGAGHERLPRPERDEITRLYEG
ncbi:MAG: AIR synthase family protein [Candidatus Promineifilaceae bacterium]